MLLADLSLHLRFSGGSGIADDSNKVQKKLLRTLNTQHILGVDGGSETISHLIKNINTKM